MSLNAMTNVAVARRTDDLGQGELPATAREQSQAAKGSEATETTASATLKAILTYIPTEIVALYIAALAAVRAGQTEASAATANGTVASQNELTTFWVFVIATPLVAWLLYAGKVRAGGKRLPARPRSWPYWEMITAPVAFAAWAYALPDSPFSRFNWYTAALGSFIVLVASTAIALLAPVFQRPLKP